MGLRTPPLRRLLAVLILVQRHAVPASAKVTATWIDVEDHEAIIVGRNASRDRGWLQNATNIAHTAGLRFAADAQVGWAFAGNSADPTRPVHQQVMDIVDEITLMDYFSTCSTDKPDGPAGRCNPTQTIYLAAPWISYASFLATTRNHSVLLDIGVSLGTNPSGSIQSELDLEVFLSSLGFLHGEQGGGQIHNLAVFENSQYEAMAKAAPCPVTDKVCAGPAGSRPARAIWWCVYIVPHWYVWWVSIKIYTRCDQVRSAARPRLHAATRGQPGAQCD